MKRKISFWIIIFAMLVQMAAPCCVSMADTVSEIRLVSGYCVKDTLYTFISMEDDYTPDNFQVNLVSGELESSDEGKLAGIAESGADVYYMLLVDRSESMEADKKDLVEFVKKLTGGEKKKAVYTVAAFGEDFEVVGKRLRDPEKVLNIIDGLEFNEKLQNPYTCVGKALDYLSKNPAKAGTLVNLVVLTNGSRQLGIDNATEEIVRQKELSNEVIKKIKNMPEVLVSTYCTGTWDETVKGALCSGRGYHLQSGEGESASKAGEDMAAYVGKLLFTSFSLTRTSSSERFSVALKLRGEGKDGMISFVDVALDNVAEIKEAQNIDEDGDKEGISGDKPGTEGEGEKKDPDISQDGKDNQEDNRDDEEKKGPGHEVLVEPSGKTKNQSLPAVIISAALAAIAVIALICIALLLRNNGGDKKKESEIPGEGKLELKPEIYAGRCLTRAKSLYLKDYLVIGSDPGCDLVFDEPDVSPQNSRIYINKGILSIEDLNSKKGTALEGMRIQGANRLRSGDVISIGNVEFSMKYFI